MITYSETRDALYVQLQESDVERTTPVDDLRIIDFAADGFVAGVESLAHRPAGACVTLPEVTRQEDQVKVSRFPIFA